MRKGKSVIGKDVLSLADGTRLMTVKDLILGANNDEVVALLVDEGGLFAASEVVPAEEIASFGRDAVVVRDRSSVRSASEVGNVQRILDRKTSLLNTKVYTETGEELGSVGDVYFEESDRRIIGLEVSGGPFRDAASGTRYLPVDEIVRIGPDVLYVKPETGQDLEGQQGGIAGALAQAGDKAREATTAVGERVRAAGEDARTRASGVGERLSAEEPGARASEAAQRALVGKRTARDVESDWGAVLVPAGRRIRAEDVELAGRHDKLGALATSAGLGEAEAVGAGIGQATDRAVETAQDVWSQFTQKLSELTDATGQRLDEEKTKRRLADIEDAVGRPVTKVILDLDDQVILDLGDIITHTAVQRAYEAGALDSLLASVYKGEVSFEKQEMQASRPGTASLEGADEKTGAPVVEQLRTKVANAEAEREPQRRTRQSTTGRPRSPAPV
jgi:uncharacterized protein YrrD